MIVFVNFVRIVGRKRHNRVKDSYEFKYFVHLFQSLFDGPMPSCFSVVNVGLRRRLVIDWEGVISELWPEPATQPNEGLLLAAQVMLTDPLRWDGYAPLLHSRLAAYRNWLMPNPPSCRAAHLDRDQLAGDVAHSLARFHAIRHQLFRYLGGHSMHAAMALRVSFERLMEPVIANDRPRGASKLVSYVDTVKLADTEGLTPMQLDIEYRLEPVGPAPRTSLHEEMAAMLRGERFGAIKDHNYLFVRHAGYAEHVESLGDTTPFHDGAVALAPDHVSRVRLLTHNVRKRLNAEYKQASDLTAVRLFTTSARLKGVSYSPEDWSVILRADASASLRESGLTARRVRTASLKPTGGRRHRFLALRTPKHLAAWADEVRLLWRESGVYVDTSTIKGLVNASVAGLSVNDFVAFDERGRLTRTPECIKTLYVHRSVLQTQGLAALAGWVGDAVPTKDTFYRLLKAKPDKQRSMPFTREMDAELLALWKPYQARSAWKNFAEKYGCKATDAKRRAEFVAFATRHRNLTLAELNDLATVERRLGPRSWKLWRATARKSSA